MKFFISLNPIVLLGYIEIYWILVLLSLFLSCLEKWKQYLDNGMVFGVLLIDFSKTFDYLSHEFFGIKLIAYGVQFSFVRLIYDYSTNRRLKIKVGNKYSS